MGKAAPRRRVFNDPGHAHELTFSTYRRTRLLEDDAHCRAFLRSLDRARKELSFQVWAYVLMPDHVHLLLWPTEPVYDMADIRQSVKQPSSKTALACKKSIDTIHDNPVVAGLCELPWEYEWSSAA